MYVFNVGDMVVIVLHINMRLHLPTFLQFSLFEKNKEKKLFAKLYVMI